MQLRAFLPMRRFEGKLNNEAKRKTKSLEFTLSVLKELHGKLVKEVGSLEAKFDEENFAWRVLLEMLKV